MDRSNFSVYSQGLFYHEHRDFRRPKNSVVKIEIWKKDLAHLRTKFSPNLYFGRPSPPTLAVRRAKAIKHKALARSSRSKTRFFIFFCTFQRVEIWPKIRGANSDFRRTIFCRFFHRDTFWSIISFFGCPESLSVVSFCRSALEVVFLQKSKIFKIGNPNPELVGYFLNYEHDSFQTWQPDSPSDHSMFARSWVHEVSSW